MGVVEDGEGGLWAGCCSGGIVCVLSWYVCMWKSFDREDWKVCKQRSAGVRDALSKLRRDDAVTR